MLNRFQFWSVILSFVSIVCVVLINREIANHYLQADGKTKALFGIVELLGYSYKYYILLPVVSAFALEWVSITRERIERYDYVIIFIAIMALGSVFIPLWKLLI